MKCPGQNTRYWKPDDVVDLLCPACDSPVEFFKDDLSRPCPSCGYRFRNPDFDLGCAEYCRYAEKCLGSLPPEEEGVVTSEGPLVVRIREAMKAEFGSDHRRIRHACAVFDWCKQLLTSEPGDPRVVLTAALLHDIGIQEAERKHGSSSAKYQEGEGPPIARRIMTEAGLDADTVEHVCRIVGRHHTADGVDTPEFRLIWDADHLVNLGESVAGTDKRISRQTICRTFRTDTGRALAIEHLPIG